ncbi:MAG: FAD-dependent oxidoreductase [Candidatus Omnitrophica bacterium]|nr:FAD-dependent oxidoreductase [Candidatus Omnitrophota bacterium]
MDDKEHFDTVILGGGFSGLYLALLLSRAGQRVAVIEKASVAGGLLRTFSCHGARFDLGGHRLVFHKNAELFSFLKEIGFQGRLLKHRRKARIYVDGCFMHYPPILWDAFKLKAELKIAILKDFLLGRFDRKKPANFEEWLCAQYGKTLYKLIFKDYTKKVWGVECSSLPPEFLKKRVGKFHFLHFMLGLQGVRSKDSCATFFYPEAGIGAVIDAIQGQLQQNVTLLVSSEAIKVEAGSVVIRALTGERTVRAKNIVSTIPVQRLIPLLGDAGLDGCREGFKTRGVIFVNLLLKKELPGIPPVHWVYLPSGDLIFSRWYMYKSWSGAMTPEGKHSLSLEIIGGEELLALSESVIMEKCFKGLRLMGVTLNAADIEESMVIKQADAYPVITNMDDVQKYKEMIMQRHPSLRLTGRMGGHAYLDVEGCVDDVRSMAQAILKHA